MDLQRTKDLVTDHRSHVLYGQDDEADLAWVRKNGLVLQQILEAGQQALEVGWVEIPAQDLRPLHDTAAGWEFPALLRTRDDEAKIECQAVVSGRWKPLRSQYWDDCVIPVQWRLKGERWAE